MDHDLELKLIADDLIVEINDAVSRAMTVPEIDEVYRPDVDAFDFEGKLTLVGTEESTREVAIRVARELRGGRDFDPTKPADNHAKFMGTSEDGRAVWRVASAFAAPAGYTE